MKTIGFIFEQRQQWRFKVGEGGSTNGRFRPHIYLRTNKTLLHNFLHEYENWGKTQAIKLQYNYSKKMFNRRAKPMWIIGDPDYQGPS